MRQRRWQKLPIIVFAVLGVFVPNMLKNDYLIHIACMIGVNILLALGMHVVTGMTGQINMGQYGFYCVGAYAYAIAATKGGVGFVVALLFAVVISALFGVLIGIPSLKVEGPYLSLCTIGFAESIRIILNSAQWAGMANGIKRIPGVSFLGFSAQSKTEYYLVIFGFVLLAAVLVSNISTSAHGLQFRAIKDDTLSAGVLGVDAVRVKLTAFVISGVLAGIAGSFYAAYSSYITPSIFTQALQVNFLLMIVLGGLGSMWGAILGATLITVVYELTRSYVQYQKIAFGIIMIFLILFLKQGIAGTIGAAVRQRMIQQKHMNMNTRKGTTK